MPMTELRIGDQIIRHDRDATAAVYARLQHGYAERCGCACCRNFAAQRNLVYPGSFRALLDQLGIDFNKEGEAFELGPLKDGWHLYNGWFYLLGEVVSAGEYNCGAADAEYFDYFFTRSHRKAAGFECGHVLAIEFSTHVRWVLAEPPPHS
jgi:hypothetical protein